MIKLTYDRFKITSRDPKSRVIIKFLMAVPVFTQYIYFEYVRTLQCGDDININYNEIIKDNKEIRISIIEANLKFSLGFVIVLYNSAYELNL